MKATKVAHPELYLLDRFDARAEKISSGGKEAVKDATRATKIAANVLGGLGSIVAAPAGALTGIAYNAIDSVSTARHGTVGPDGKSFVLQGSRLEKTAAWIGGAAFLGLAAAMAYDVSFFLLDSAWIAPTAAAQVGAGLGVMALGVGASLRGAYRGAINGVKSAFGLARKGVDKVEEGAKHLLAHGQPSKNDGAA